MAVRAGGAVADHCATRTQEEYSGISKPQRLALHRAAQAALGEEEGDTLMALSPPANTAIATRQDVALSVSDLRAEILKRLDVVQWRIIATVVVSVLTATLAG